MKLSEVKMIVTGGARGMGAHFCRRLAEAGASVCAGDVNEAGLATLAGEARGLPGNIHTRKLNVANPDETEAFVDWAHTAMGGLNALVSNAAILRDALLVKRDRKTGAIKKMSRDQLMSVIDINLIGAIWIVRDVVAKMAETGTRPGVVINMSSLARHGNRGQTNYVAAKAALASNTVTWAREFAPMGIRVGAIAPGMIETPMTAGMNPKALESLVSMIPAGRIGVPEDIWLGVKFILENEYFTGRCLDIDGGLSM